MEKETKKINYMIILVGLLLVFSLVQTIQISALEDKTSSGSTDNGYATSSSSQQKPVANTAPTMVGGC